MTITAIHIEGNLIAPDMTADISAGEIRGQINIDFGLEKSVKLEDEIAFAWGEAKDQWRIYQRRLERIKETDTATSETREYWAVPLLRLLGYEPIYQAKAEIIDGQTFAISHRSNQVVANDEIHPAPPIHIIGSRLSLDKKPPSGNPRLSAHALLQEYLNKTEHLWGIVTNGLCWRLLRDCSLMTRLSYIEFDLEQILNGENFAEFSLFYRLFHRSRLPVSIDDVDSCLLEFYHQEALQQGGRVRDRLRDGVEFALKLLGNGFLQHPANNRLRHSLTSNLSSGKEDIDHPQATEKGDKLTETQFYRQLLLLIYRLLFLMVAESRNLLLAGEDEEKARIYNEYYSIDRLRAFAERLLEWERPAHHRREGFQDKWQGLRVTFSLFDESWRGQLLGLSPLNGDLFGSKTLTVLDDCAIDNYDLLRAIRHLSLYENKGLLRRVNYAALDVEELGSVYESLLDYTPKVTVFDGIYHFRLVTGSDRKTTGSYYTPPELVGQLIKSALEPVIEDKLKGCDTQEEKITALLSIKVCDPSCGSGHFLLAAARRIGKELARIRTGEMSPTPEALRVAIRDVIQNCIYGVDLNPLAVDLCKVALWMEGFCKGFPLNFLDHRIKWGNSLVGILDISVLNEGIPDNAFKAVTGDDKTSATLLKKRNKQEKQEKGQLSIFDHVETDRSEYGKTWRELGNIPENSTDEVKRKQRQYQQSHSAKNEGWWRDFSACNLWTSAFFMALTEQNLQLLPTSKALQRLLSGMENTETGVTVRELVESANRLAREKGFFHWCLEFPEVFDPPLPPLIRGENEKVPFSKGDLGGSGFDCVLGNPPWERIKLQEKEFFGGKDESIANARNKAERTRLIKKLAQTNPNLLQQFEDEKHFAEAQSKFIRESGRFPLTAKGDINTYAIFAETVRDIINNNGRCGVIVPTGIATDNTTKDFFGDLIQRQSLASLYDFENREAIFSSVHRSYKFSLLVMTNKSIKSTNFAFFLTQVKHLENKQRVFTLAPEDIALINPNTLTCPVFRTRQDADLTKKIYQRIPVLENESTGENPWGISFMRMFDMANDSNLFKDEKGENLLPLYEAKMFHHFDHRWASYDDQRNTNDVSLDDKNNPDFFVTPRYWVDKKEVENRLANKWNKEWLLGFRRITNATNERTAIFDLLPKYGCGDSIALVLPSTNKANLICCLLANFSNLVFDFVIRQKLGATTFNMFYVKQLPVIPPENYSEEDIEYISSRVLELVYTANDLKPFAEDLGYEGKPFIWDEQRRAILRAELDAKYAKLYGLNRDELRYILDPTDIYGDDFPSETFRVLKNNEIRKYGEYRTQRLVLAAWDMMGY